MVTKKDMAVAILATFCLTSTLFMAIPIKSQVGTTSSNEYDPWIDTNDDGIIDIFDIAALALAFGAEGTPINKTALILELQSRVDSLNASLIDLMNQLDNIYEVEIAAYCSYENRSLVVGIAKDDALSSFNTSHKFILFGNHTFTVPAIGPDNYVFTHWSTGNNETTITISSSGQYIAYYQPPAPDWFDGLVGYWKFDDGEGTIAFDSSGYGNNGTINGPVWIGGKYGWALDFDGVNDWVEVPKNPSLNIVNGITVAAWVYLKASTVSGVILSSWWDGTEPDRGIGLSLLPGYFYFGVIDDNNCLLVPFSFGINMWYYLVATWDGSVSKAYVNGVEIGSRSTSGSFTNQNVNLGIGSDINPFAWCFNGTIDEVTIYNRALSQEEILGHYLYPPP